MSRHDTMDALTGFGVLLALTPAVAAFPSSHRQGKSRP
jgi:hypothetical protein